MQNKNIIAVQNLLRCLDIESLKNPDVIANLVRAFGIVQWPDPAFGEDEKFKNPSADMAGIAQTPNQIAKALVYLSDFEIKTYLEIGIFHGGNFLFVSEYLRRFNPEIQCLGIDPGEFLNNEICEIIEHEDWLTFSKITSDDIAKQKFDLVFIDGDHNDGWAERDYNNIGKFAQICMIHDIIYLACPEVGSFWKTVKNNTAIEFLESSALPAIHGIGLLHGVNTKHNPETVKKQAQTFLHSGDTGDVVYSLPAIKELGGGKIFLDPLWEATLFNENNAKLLIPLLVAQPYIEDVALYNGEAIDYDLNRFRYSGLDLVTMNLSEAYLRTFSLPTDLINKQWLNVGKRKVKSVIFHRSARYHNNSFPWKDLVNRFKNQAVFVGLEEEHEQFVKSFGHIPFYKVCDFLELAEVINGADLFIGNQSLPFAISEALHKKNCLEVCEDCPNCNFKRKDHNIDGMNYERTE